MNKTTTNSNPELLLTAVKLHRLAKFAEARQLYQQILSTEPNHFDAQHFSGLIAKQNGQPLQAIALITAALNSVTGEFNANHASAFCNLGAAYQDCQQPELALQNYRQALLLKPDYAIAHNNLGNALKNLGNYDEAITSYQHALRYSPNYPEALFNYGLTLHLNQQFDEALVRFEQAIQIKPGYAEAHFALGNTYQSLRMFELALHSYDQSIALKADYAKAYLNRGITLNRLAQYHDAVSDFELAIHHQPGYAYAYFYLGNSLRQLQKNTEAIAAYLRAEEFGFDQKQVSFALAALGIGEVPAAAPVDYVKELFNQYADHFDTHLVDVLNYDVPKILSGLIDKYRQHDQLASVDLGCGTGLCGAYLRPYSRSLTGVDLSQNMLNRAAALNLYDQLVCAELTEFLSRYTQTADLIIAADVLLYLGDLNQVFKSISHALNHHGFFCFSVEYAKEQSDYVLRASNRYAHTENYLRRLAANYGFTILELARHAGRQENQQDNDALVVLLLKE